MNQCTFLGTLTRDPQLNPTKSGSKVVDFGLVTYRFYKRADGESVSEPTYIELELWDSAAELFNKIFRKGDGVAIEASAKNLDWTDTDGIKRHDIVFRVNHFYKLKDNQ